jgi:hypothetical protein
LFPEIPNLKSKYFKIQELSVIINFISLPMSIPSKLYLRKTSIEFLMNVFLKLHFTLNDYFFVNLKKNISYKSSSFEVNFLNFSIPALAPPSDNNLYLI